MAVIGSAVLCLVAYALAAWFFRFDLGGDLASAHLQIEDIAAGACGPASGGGSPSGQEPGLLVNALSYRWFGRTTFALRIGTLFFFLLAILHTARLAYQASGAWGAAISLLICAAAPIGFLRLSVSPRGSHALLLFLSMALLDIGCRLIVRSREGAGKRQSPYPTHLVLFLGILAGAAFRCGDCIIAPLASVVLSILILAPHLPARPLFWILGCTGLLLGRILSWPVGPWTAGTFLPAIPETAFDWPSILANASALVHSWAALLIQSPASTGLPALLMPAVLVPIALMSLYAVGPTGSGQSEKTPPSGSGVPVLLLLTYLVFFLLESLFRFPGSLDAPSVLITIWPILAILLARCCIHGRKRAVQALSLALVPLFVFWNVSETFSFYRDDADRERLLARARQAAAILDDADIRTAYAPYELYGLNLAQPTRKTIFSDPVAEPRPDFRLALERDDHPGIVGDHMEAAAWVVASGGSISTGAVDGLPFAFPPIPPQGLVEEIAPARWHSATNRLGRELAGRLTDRSARLPVHLANDEIISISLESPLPVTGLRLYGQPTPFLGGFSLYGRSTTNRPFHRLTPEVPETGLAWSGTRFYFYDDALVREARFPREELLEIQVRFATRPETPCGEVHEIQLLRPAAEPPAGRTPSPETALPSLLSLLRRQGVRRLYAERWIANHVTDSTQGAIWTNWGGLPIPGTGIDTRIELDGSTAVLMATSGVPSLRETFQARGFLMREIAIPPFGHLFLPESNQEIPLGSSVPTAIAFHENYALSIPDNAWVRRELDALEEKPDATNLLRLYRQAPDSAPLLESLLFVTSDTEKRKSIRTALDDQVIPAIGKGFPADFEGGITWRGLRLLDPETTANPNGLFIRSYWAAPPSLFGKRHVLTYRLSSPGTVPAASFSFSIAPTDYDMIDGEGKRFWHVDSYLPIPIAFSGRDPVQLVFSLSQSSHPSRPLPVRTDLPTRRNEVILNDVSAFPRTLSSSHYLP